MRDPPQIVRLFESSFKRFLDKALRPEDLREDFRWRRERRRCERRGMSCLRLEIFLAKKLARRIQKYAVVEVDRLAAETTKNCEVVRLAFRSGKGRKPSPPKAGQQTAAGSYTKLRPLKFAISRQFLTDYYIDF